MSLGSFKDNRSENLDMTRRVDTTIWFMVRARRGVSVVHGPPSAPTGRSGTAENARWAALPSGSSEYARFRQDQCSSPACRVLVEKDSIRAERTKTAVTVGPTMPPVLGSRAF